MADMAGVPGGGGGEAAEAERHHDVRVNVKSKRMVTDQLAKYKSLFGKLLERQPELNQSDVQKMVEEMMLNFEIAVQENINVGGLSWEEAAEENSEEYECSTVDDLLDDKIVQTSWKRSVYPKKILPYFVRSLKAERKLMSLFESTVKPQEVKRDPVQDAIMSNVSATAPRMFKQAATVMKSLSQVGQRAEGLHQVLITRPSAETLEAYRDVFSGSDGKHCEVQCSSEFALKHSIRRAASEREYSLQYASVSPHNTHQ
ncbi:kinetochore-associated protein NSL1-like [Silurus asotus]|uniref:Kinetochore-associated protein NSL1-like n=1 Tax=Silurus asotus TaxID=30991 RepID=A0AAD5FT70_SILAS|nr:kinetochore-associated protein NSL1-like [Silurus asotus]